ncbi:hypothetical protein D9613_006211 [Agrocybe pediades]|uniref:F-box domain-containing protein n=1 Tax=Agrocybe pediades TaxID=84607 RepID=A0A8H4VPK2_9AGAR|nr:hypothetical protein D9613_006211 [Agrocybe pediades]
MLASEAFSLSPISRLHEEIMWMIFLKNTNIHDDLRLTTALCSSQVCQKWRQLMLNSPSIWGRLIDLLDLRYTTSAWVEEIVSRSQNAPLWITGPLRAYQQSPVDPHIFLPLIRKNWERIEILEVSDYWDSGQDHAGYWRRLFSRPAPLLKELTFWYTCHSGPTRASPQTWLLPSPLLNGTAPGLRNFEICRQLEMSGSRIPDKFTMDMPLSWFSNLRSFALRQDLDVDRLLELLRATPLLETLTITRFAASATESTKEQRIHVSLPRLAYLSLTNWDAPDIVRFLESISASVGCCLFISKPLQYPPFPHQAQVIARAELLFARYVQEYFDRHQVAQLSLSYDNHYLGIEEIPLSESAPWYSHFSLFIPHSEANSWIVQLILTSPFFAHVAQLDLSNWEQSIPYAPSAFNSADTVKLQCEGLKSLLKYFEEDSDYSDNDLLLPNLHTLTLHGEELSSEHELHSVVSMRQHVSRPISVLDLSDIEAISCNLDALDGFVGLSIVFPRTLSTLVAKRDYVCGTGHPEVLRFHDPRYYDPSQTWLDQGRHYRRTAFKVYMYGWSGRSGQV